VKKKWALFDDDYMSHYVERREVVNKSGRYRVEGAVLYLTYEGNGATEAIPIRFDCEKLIAGDTASPKLAATPIDQLRPAADPIVSQWQTTHPLGATTWDFKPDSAFYLRTESRIVGKFAKTRQGLQVDWMSGSAVELWELRCRERSSLHHHGWQHRRVPAAANSLVIAHVLMDPFGSQTRMIK
jgi:hypothetical protein